MTNQAKLMTITLAALLALALQAGRVSAFDSPPWDPTDPRVQAPPPCPTPPVWRDTHEHEHEHESEPSEPELTLVELGWTWTAPAWDPLDVSYQAGPE